MRAIRMTTTQRISYAVAFAVSPGGCTSAVEPDAAKPQLGDAAFGELLGA
jgi:hypothetical protein